MLTVSKLVKTSKGPRTSCWCEVGKKDKKLLLLAHDVACPSQHDQPSVETNWRISPLRGDPRTPTSFTMRLFNVRCSKTLPGWPSHHSWSCSSSRSSCVGKTSYLWARGWPFINLLRLMFLVCMYGNQPWLPQTCICHDAELLCFQATCWFAEIISRCWLCLDAFSSSADSRRWDFFFHFVCVSMWGWGWGGVA